MDRSVQRDGRDEAVPKPKWETVEDEAGLVTIAAEAVAQGKPLFVELHAEWCVPCKQLQAETLAHPQVRALLAERFVTARVDLTDGEERMQALLWSRALPALRVYAPVPELSPKLAAGKAKPDVSIDTFVEAPVLLEALALLLAR